MWHCEMYCTVLYCNTDRNLMVESTTFDGKPEPLGISAI